MRKETTSENRKTRSW